MVAIIIMEMEESKVYLLKDFNLGKATKLRRATVVCREREWYDKQSIGIWWKWRLGVGVMKQAYKQFKYFMFGISFINVKIY